MTKIPISFLVLTYNEAARIESVLSHAVQWADEIVVLDKSSTDSTREICERFGAKVRVHTMPFSPQGFDDFIEYAKASTHDWIYFSTASEIPTKRLVQEMRELLDKKEDFYDAIQIPRKMYSMGSHFPDSPWAVAYYPFLFNRKRAILRNVIHSNVVVNSPNRMGRVEYSDSCCVYHLTHASARKFWEAHLPYVEEEARGVPDHEIDYRIHDSFARIRDHLPGILKSGDNWPELMSAWCIYQLGVCLFLCERRKGGDAIEFYKALREKLLSDEWGVGEQIPPHSPTRSPVARMGEFQAKGVMRLVCTLGATYYYCRHPMEIKRPLRFHLGAMKRKLMPWLKPKEVVSWK